MVGIQSQNVLTAIRIATMKKRQEAAEQVHREERAAMRGQKYLKNYVLRY